MTFLSIIAVCFLGLLAVDAFFAWADGHCARKELKRGSSEVTDPACVEAEALDAEFEDAVFDWPTSGPTKVAPLFPRRSQKHPYLRVVHKEEAPPVQAALQINRPLGGRDDCRNCN